MTQWFSIARVLPERLSLNGSSASAEILAATLRHMGHEVSIVDVHGPEDAPGTVDIVTVGSGSTSQIAPAATDLISLVRVFHSWKASGSAWVAVGTGWDLLGEALITAEGETMPGAGVFPSTADHRAGRFSGEVHGLDFRGRPSAGYINQIGTTELLGDAQALMTLDDAPEGWPTTEGLVAENLFATKVGGPALALNPHWTLDIVSQVLASRGLTAQLGDFHERVGVAARNARALIDGRLSPRRR
jgi:CobQ-like glutamine amidotransferase family enzyme